MEEVRGSIPLSSTNTGRSEGYASGRPGCDRVEDPVFLYNIAQCHRLLGENAEAVRFYRRYLEAAPAASVPNVT